MTAFVRRAWAFCLCTFFIQSAYAYTSLYTSSSQPASVSATLDVSCEDAYEVLIKNLPKQLSSAPYVKSVRSLAVGDWEKQTNGGGTTTQTRADHYSVNFVTPKEFPTTVFSTDLHQSLCPEVQDAGAGPSCTNSRTLKISGQSASIYRKVIELGGASNPFQSFDVDFSFSDASPTTCSFSSYFTISNSKYLQALKHLLTGTEPSQVEKAVLEHYVAWATSILDAMEGQ